MQFQQNGGYDGYLQMSLLINSLAIVVSLLFTYLMNYSTLCLIIQMFIFIVLLFNEFMIQLSNQPQPQLNHHTNNNNRKKRTLQLDLQQEYYSDHHKNCNQSVQQSQHYVQQTIHHSLRPSSFQHFSLQTVTSEQYFQKTGLSKFQQNLLNRLKFVLENILIKKLFISNIENIYKINYQLNLGWKVGIEEYNVLINEMNSLLYDNVIIKNMQTIKLDYLLNNCQQYVDKVGYFDVVLNDQLKQRKQLDRIMDVSNDRISLIKKLAVLSENIDYDPDLMLKIFINQFNQILGIEYQMNFKDCNYRLKKTTDNKYSLIIQETKKVKALSAIEVVLIYLNEIRVRNQNNFDIEMIVKKVFY